MGCQPEDTFLENNVLRLLGVHFDTVFDVGASMEDLDGVKKVEWVCQSKDFFLLKPQARRYRSAEEFEQFKCELCFVEDPFTNKSFSERTDIIVKTLVMNQPVGQNVDPRHIGVPYNSSSTQAGPLEVCMFKVMLGTETIPESFEKIPGRSQGDQEVDFYIPLPNIAEVCGLGRRPVYTKNGRIGLVPASTKPDDRIVILYGSIVPFIMRIDP
ncbi:MAG: hypothetical protein LQ342_005680 [Letrouitia transgressa]|nr:MAG: hypothetical protein LQ342_005680 [Letrouitia transgressa]